VHISFIIITRDEQPRLRLCLASLARQAVNWQRDAELIIVDDGSAPAVGSAEIPPALPTPRIIRHERSRGRSAARNAGAGVARGERMLFLDGDVLLAPEAGIRHGRLGPNELGRGEQRHLRGTRFFRDPRTWAPWPGKEALVRSLGDLSSRLVTEQMIDEVPFDRWVERSETAIYPGAAPRKLYDLEMSALRARTAPLAEWTTDAYELVWERGDWRIWSETQTPGPTPLAHPSETPSTPEQLRTALAGFTRYPGSDPF